jgi:hypothetical protein
MVVRIQGARVHSLGDDYRVLGGGRGDAVTQQSHHEGEQRRENLLHGTPPGGWIWGRWMKSEGLFDLPVHSIYPFHPRRSRRKKTGDHLFLFAVLW